MLVALLLTLVTQADVAPPPGAELEIERARLLISDLYEEQGLELLGTILADPALPPALRVRALIYSGVAQLNLGHDESGRRAFREALAIDIGATLPEWVSRRVRVVFDAELVQVLRPKPVVVEPVKPVRVVEPVVTPVPAAPERKPWVAAALTGGLLTSAAFSVWGFSRFSAQYTHAQHARVALDAQRLDASSRGWLVMGEIATAAAFACAAGILWWWLRPLPN